MCASVGGGGGGKEGELVRDGRREEIGKEK